MTGYGSSVRACTRIIHTEGILSVSLFVQGSAHSVAKGDDLFNDVSNAFFNVANYAKDAAASVGTSIAQSSKVLLSSEDNNFYL